jgi:hypothetical protein
MAIIKTISAGVAIGMLMRLVTKRLSQKAQTYLMRNTHLHVEFELSAPPMIGPTSKERA